MLIIYLKITCKTSCLWMVNFDHFHSHIAAVNFSCAKVEYVLSCYLNYNPYVVDELARYYNGRGSANSGKKCGCDS